ncbi:entericidin A/B family lipoprotein [Coxiella burnetii]|uniref:Entericidin A n=4 Tax=Coxiella burnetii TaxID=777 RepID=Q83F63_COXBU|nr:entericidin A/B family lipoprotein [Coxiella burnetii]NP_819138.1 entericidin A [Coxiella burnetii RSA 493]AAO89652.1 entericidin A precursor [Coxiella burnetii RSA 493]ABS76594.1 entericidin A precursor [Coxiella burnetii Dugway 5J108-111]ABX78457.1 entericidin B [Coxiella burnetii RSA 331]ACJ19178.1 entericidin A precursor [Coxiella burnetii CbuG_Q212]ACJ21079.1 entericidin A precursor [Coxiella burnetii CbuK_Q154]
MLTTRLKIILSIISLSLFMTGCHTIRGFGQDLQAGGKAISHAAAKEESNKK